MPRLKGTARLNGPELKALREAILDAYPIPNNFDVMFQSFFGYPRQTIALGNDMQFIVFTVINRAEAEAWTLELLVAARQESPNNPELMAFAQSLGLAPLAYGQSGGESQSQQPLSRQRFEKLVVDSNSMMAVEQWRERMTRLEAQICRVEVPSADPPAYGTGFLLGSKVVITNHHVMTDVLAGLVDPQKVVLRFDYRQKADGVEVRPGVTYRLAAGDDWLIDESPPSASDYTDGEAKENELDYVLLRVDGAPGNDPVGGLQPPTPEGHVPTRGWMTLPNVAPELEPDHPLLILQHPKGDPLKLAIDTNAIIKVNAKGTRVRYRTNTEEGSSGSPCFDANWNLVALHHLGDPAFPSPGGLAEFNQGIPFTAIQALLQERGKLDSIDI